MARLPNGLEFDSAATWTHAASDCCRSLSDEMAPACLPNAQSLKQCDVIRLLVLHFSSLNLKKGQCNILSLILTAFYS